MLFLPYCNEFFIQMEVFRIDSARAKQIGKGGRIERALPDGGCNPGAQTQLNPSPAPTRAPVA